MKKTSVNNKPLIYGGLFGGAILLILLVYLIIKKAAEAKKIEESNKNASKDTRSSGSIAQQIKAALSDFDTDENYIIELGGRVCDLEKLRLEYKTLYKSDLITDLSKSLNSSEIERFKKNVALNKGNCLTDKNGNTVIDPTVRTPEYCKKIAQQLRIALGAGGYFDDADENRLVELSTQIYDFECVSKEYNILYKQDLKKLIDDAFDPTWEQALRDKFYSNIEENRNR